MRNEELLKSLNNNSTINPNEIIIEKITQAKLINILKQHNKTLIHFWGSWCPSVTFGLDAVKDFIDDKDVNVVLVSIDICSKDQVEIMKKILVDKNIKIKSYILENDFGKDMDGLSKFRTMDHIYNIISSFDKNYQKYEVVFSATQKIELSPIPYTAIIDNNMNVLYSKTPDIQKNISIPPDNKKFYILDIQTMKSLLDIKD
jgi:thiol-disulfide isomerase/thioredoxin